MGYPTEQQVIRAAYTLTAREDATFIRTVGFWHVLMFLRYDACHRGGREHTFENSYDLAEAAFDLNGVSLPINEDSREVYFEPGATQGNQLLKFFRHKEGPRQTYLNRIYTGLAGGGPRQPKFFSVSSNSLPTKVSLVQNWIEALREDSDNRLLFDELTHEFLTWIFRFGVPTRSRATAHISNHAGNGTMKADPEVKLLSLPSTLASLRDKLQRYFGLSQTELQNLLPQLDTVRPEEWIGTSPVSPFSLGPGLMDFLASKDQSKSPQTDRVNSRAGENIIFFGPPGTGKSERAQRLAGDSPEPVRVLFHPEYTYADFFGAYKPVVGSESGADQIIGFDGEPRSRPVPYFAFVAGPLLKCLARALADPENHYTLIVDEINRGDCAAIFGDILQLLDRDADGGSKYFVSLSQEAAEYLRNAGVKSRTGLEGNLRFPPNFTILATMNTSDQNLYPMDSAFKRRWQWRSCGIAFKPLVDFLGRDPFLKDARNTWNWVELLKIINRQIARYRQEDKLLGPWFILPSPDGSVDVEAFANKCLYYLWHDVFKDDQSSPSSPFEFSSETMTFQQVQDAFMDNGLEGVFKKEMLEPLKSLTPDPA